MAELMTSFLASLSAEQLASLSPDQRALYERLQSTRTPSPVRAPPDLADITSKRPRQSASRLGGSPLPNGMVAVANQTRTRPRQKRLRGHHVQATEAPQVQTVLPTITTASYDTVLSTEPIWRLANTHLPEADRFPEPPPELTSLHRRVSGNLSRFMRGDIRQIIVAHMMMLLCTVIAKQEQIFGRDQGVEGGGPYLACSKTIFPPPNTVDQHAETHVKGFCQLSKTYETIGQAFHCFFVEGLLPVIFVRNKGGATVGTADMSKGVLEFNSVVKRIFDDIKHFYRNIPTFAGVQPEEFWLQARRSSYQETLEFKGHGQLSYLLRSPQVIIACTNTVQLEPFHSAPKGAYVKRALDSGQPRLSYFQIFSGERDTRHAVEVNPYLPWTYDVSLIGQTNVKAGSRRMLPAIAALFDEDDANRSSTGNEKKETMLFSKVPGLKERLNALQRASAAAEVLEDDDDDLNANHNDEQKDECEAALFYRHFRGLRASFALVIAYSATPTTALFALGGGASEIDIHMVEITPGKGYIGYRTEHMMQLAPHLRRHVQMVELPNRVVSKAFALKDIYPTVFSDMGGFDIEHHEMPEPFKRTTAGTITLKVTDYDEEVVCPNGKSWYAKDFRDTALEALGLTKVRADAFWYADGNNITHILKDMDARKDAYPNGYRSALYMTNFSKSEVGKRNFVSTILGFQGEFAHLSRGLITIEFDHRYTRLTWLNGEVDEEALHIAVEDLKSSDDPIAVEWARACMWGTSQVPDAMDDDSESGSSDGVAIAAHTLQSSISNINYAYSVLHAYMIKMQARPSASGARPFFLKMLAFAGEIGARGVRYKSHEHALVLTDMYFAFNVSRTAQVTAHGAAVIQSIGRLCTLVLDPDATPDVKLWIPSNCKDFCELWLAVMDSLPALYAHKHPGETTEQLIERLATMNPPYAEFQHVFQHFAAPTGFNKKNEPLYARPNHQFRKAKAFAEQLAMSTAAAGTTPSPMDVKDNTLQMSEATCAQAVSIAIERGEAARQAEADEDDEDAEAGVHAVMGPPAVDGIESVPQPTRVKVTRPPQSSRKGKSTASDDEYKWTPSDRRDADDALQQLREFRQLYARDEQPPCKIQMRMFACWYNYFVFAEGAARGPHGLKTRNTRCHYSKCVKHLTSVAGQEVFRSLDCLPKAKNVEERDRFRALVVKYYGLLHGEVLDGLASNPWKKDIDNMVSWAMKYLDMFSAGDLRYFVCYKPIPTVGSLADGRSSSRISSVGANVMHLDSDND